MPTMNGQGWLKPTTIVTVVGTLLVLVALHSVPQRPGSGDLPAFPVGDSDARKKAFFSYLRPIVENRNARIRRQRAWLLGISKADALGWLDQWRLRRLAERYGVDLDSLSENEAFTVLKRRVDTVPVSLALVQAAKESGWGRSRFARQGNALYGERCFQAGCGMVPRERAAGRGYEVQSFANVGDSVESYLKNLNTHETYIALRKARHRLRELGQPVTGTKLARHLHSYSAGTDSYVQSLQALIRQNDLEDD